MPAPKDPKKYEEWRKKLKAAKKNFVPWNKGVKYSEDLEYDEYREKLSNAQKDRYAESGGSPLKGRKVSDETRAKLSKAHEGKRIGFANGGKHSAETKRKMSNSHSNVPLSKDHRKAISDATNRTLRDGTHNFFHIDMKTKYKSGHHHSPKAGKVHYRSSYELAFFQQLDAEPEVSTYEVETLQIPYKFEGKKRTYIPDVLIHYVDGTQEIVEIKPEALLDTPENDAKLEAAFKQYGDQFLIVTEQELFQ